MYTLGIDLGTTFTAAATWRDGRVEMASLGSRSAVIPSVVLLRADETVLTGEAAHRRGLSEPHRVSREFKRRIGDTTPILLGGAPYSAEALMAKLLRSVIDQLAGREGEPPARMCVSHPANWGPYKKDLLTQAVRLAGVDCPVEYTTEPQAAAVFYAHQQRVEPGAVVAVYDLGGGTFDAAVLRKTATGFELLGQPEGIERLGGIDFDAAVFSHVRRSLGGKLEELDEDDPAAIAAVARLREECVDAKEALSSDTDATIPVLLPNVTTEVRLTRAELETMVRPTLHSTIEALRRALDSAGVTPEQLHSVLLVGGSSRMPLVAQMVGAELGRPVAVDAHPKHAVALGAAWLASGQRAGAVPAGRATPTRPSRGAAAVPLAGNPAPSSPAPARTYAAAAVPVSPASPARTRALPPTSPAGPPARRGATPAVPPTGPARTRALPPTSPAGPPATRGGTPAMPPATVTGKAAVPSQAPAARRSRTFAPASVPVRSQATTPRVARTASPPVRPAPPARPAGPARSGRRTFLVISAILLALALVGAGAAWAVTRDNDQTGGGEDPTSAPTEDINAGDGTGDQGNEPGVPADEQCTEEIQSNQRWVCLTSATLADDQLVIEYQAEWAGDVPDINGGYHLHLWGSDGTNPPAEIMGTHAGGQAGQWAQKDDYPAVLTADEIAENIGDQPKVCAGIAHGEHGLVTDASGGYATGNCVPIT